MNHRDTENTKKEDRLNAEDTETAAITERDALNLLFSASSVPSAISALFPLLGVSVVHPPFSRGFLRCNHYSPHRERAG